MTHDDRARSIALSLPVGYGGGTVMATHQTHHTLRETILIVVRNTPGYTLEELIRTCSEFTWNQVFVEVDRLSRSGEVHMKKCDRFGYTLTVALPESPQAGSGRHVTDASPTPSARLTAQQTGDGPWVGNH